MGLGRGPDGGANLFFFPRVFFLGGGGGERKERKKRRARPRSPRTVILPLSLPPPFSSPPLPSLSPLSNEIVSTCSGLVTSHAKAAAKSPGFPSLSSAAAAAAPLASASRIETAPAPPAAQASASAAPMPEAPPVMSTWAPERKERFLSEVERGGIALVRLVAGGRAEREREREKRKRKKKVCFERMSSSSYFFLKEEKINFSASPASCLLLLLLPVPDSKARREIFTRRHLGRLPPGLFSLLRLRPFLR